MNQISRRAKRSWLWAAAGLVVTGLAAASIVPTTMLDFHLSGTQVGDVPQGNIFSSLDCMYCHGPLGEGTDPYACWSGSLMAQGGRDPLFFAQMATANQDVANAGYFCLRCHVPLSMVSGTALDPTGNSLTDYDIDGVTCHFCHTLVNPHYEAGVSPEEDLPILQALQSVPEFYGNSMFVLDTNGVRRGPRHVTGAHQVLYSEFHHAGDLCGTCHDVGNVCVSKQPDGTYRYNNLNEPTPSEDLWTQFPLERTYTEWKLSAFANGGVDMGGIFGGTNGPVVSTCQDCHMPGTVGRACAWGPIYPDLAQHDFAGASAWVLQIIGIHYAGDPNVDPKALAIGEQKAIAHVQKAAVLQLQQQCDSVRVRVINNAGHKLPTGHIEGRRVWLNVKMFDAANNLVHEYGHYDVAQGELDEPSTKVYEMHVGLSPFAANATGLPAGVTTHMALADTIMKDNRIPPRGFDNATYAAGGAPPVGAAYADGQYWDDTNFAIPSGVTRTQVTVNYQTVTRHYIEALFNGNTTNNWGTILHDLWLQTDKDPPIPITSQTLKIVPPRVGDINCDGAVNVNDLLLVINAWGPCPAPPTTCPADINGDGFVNVNDLLIVINNWG